MLHSEDDVVYGKKQMQMGNGVGVTFCIVLKLTKGTVSLGPVRCVQIVTTE